MKYKWDEQMINMEGDSNQQDKFSGYSFEDSNHPHYNQFDTSGVPNNLFEMKQKQLQEQSKNIGQYPSSDRYASISSDPNWRDNISDGVSSDGYLGKVGSYFGTALEKTRDIACTVKNKMTEYEVTDKVKSTGEKTFDILKYTGSTIFSTSKDIVQSETTRNIVNKASSGVGYLFNRIWYGTADTNTQSVSSNDFDNDNSKGSTFIGEDSMGTGSNYEGLSRYAPPSKNSSGWGSNSNMEGNILFKKEPKYSSRSYMDSN